MSHRRQEAVRKYLLRTSFAQAHKAPHLPTGGSTIRRNFCGELGDGLGFGRLFHFAEASPQHPLLIPSGRKQV